VWHVRVNAIADYYDIKQLADLAKAKIKGSILESWDVQAFIDAAKEAIRETGDKEVREMMGAVAAEHVGELATMDQLVDVVGDFALPLLKNQARVEQELRQKLLQLEADYGGEQRRREIAEVRASRLVESIDRCREKLSKRDACRNPRCKAEFHCYIEQSGQSSNPVYRLRCEKCGSKP
jgi:hypothetical protein